MRGVVAFAICSMVMEGAEAASDWGVLSATVAILSDYRSFGVSQSSRRVTPQTSLNWKGPDGWHAGTKILPVEWGYYSPSYLINLTAGKSFDLAGTDLDLQAYYMAYPDAPYLAGKKASYFAGIATLSRSFGPFRFGLLGMYAPEMSRKKGQAFIERATASYRITDWLSVSAGIGDYWIEYVHRDRVYFDIGFTLSKKPWSLDIRFDGNNVKTSDEPLWATNVHRMPSNLVVTFSYTFDALL